MKVLILGDGNFSFSLAFAQRVAQLDASHHITSTSFDALADLHGKYPETKSVFIKLSKMRNVTIVHGIDATRISSYFSEMFDEIIFNFPHLGREDLHSHRALVAHYFDSAMSRLSADGTIGLALTEEQERNWDISASAQRLGLDTIAKLPLRIDHWPGYHFKRHHIGKSFAGRVRNCYHYCYRRSGSNTSLVSILQQLSTVATAQAEAAASASSSSATGVGRRTQKRVHALVDGRYRIDGADCYTCSECERSFATEQGVQTHVYNVHIYVSPEAAASQSIDSEPIDLVCKDCGKTCPDTNSLRQHQVAKHTGAHLHIPPYWVQPAESEPAKAEAEAFAPVKEDAAAAIATCRCSVCLWGFASAEELVAHQTEGFIPSVSIAPVFHCANCSKSFTQERALLQHANFCTTSSSS